MAVQDYKINYKSDFVLNINGDAGWAIPFCIKFWTGMPSQAYFVGFDGVKYVNCRVGDTPTQLLVMFDDHHLPIGKLEMQIAYHTTIEEFPGSVFDEVTNARDVIVNIDGTDYQVMLDFTGEDAPELEFNLPAYANEAERIQNELQRQQNEADRIAAELQREQATAAAVQGAENVNAQLNGTTLTVTNRNGVSTSVNTKGEQGEQGPVGPQGPQGEQGETGISIVSFTPKSETSTTLIYTVTFSDDTTEEVAVPKGPQGDTGLTGNGIASTTLNSDYTLTVNYTDGTSYTTPSIRGAQGVQGVSVIGFTQTGETETNTVYNLVFSDGRTQSVAIPKGAKGDKGDTGNTGAQGAQGPKGDTVTATDYTLYNAQGGSSEGAMSQDATTKAISAQTGYYTCGTPEGTPEKVVTVESGNLYKRTLGGHFKVKMTNKNTAASGVTLQIGSETSAALWYNGATVSVSNSWEEGEVISVYFDGTNYQASNSQGGGGKFATGEKVKDVSIESTPTINHTDAVVSSDGLAQILYISKSEHNVEYAVKTPQSGRVAYDTRVNDGYEISFQCNNGYLALCGTTNSSYLSFINTYCDYVSSFSMKYQGNPAYFRILIKKSDGSNITTGEAIANVSASIKYFTYQQGGLVSDVEYCKENIAFHDEESVSPILTNGYIDSNGNLQTNSSSVYRYTQLIPVVKGMVISTKVCGNGTIVIGAYSESNTDVAIVDKSVIGDNTVQALEYTVPIGVDYVRISFRNNDVRDFYVNKLSDETVKQSVVRIDEEIAGINTKIDDVVSGLLMQIKPDDIYTGKSYYNGSLINTADGRVGKYNLDNINKIYVTTSWLSAAAGFYMVTFFDSGGNILSQLYPNTANVELTLDKQELTIPTGAAYMYVNSRYVANYPAAYTDFNTPELQSEIEKQQKEISILFIGNSLTQDAITYVPYLLKTLNPDLRYRFYMWYCGGYNLTQQLEKITNDQVCEIFSVCEGGISWDNKNSSVKMSQILSTYKFDIVCLQEYFNYRTEPDISAFNGIVEYIENNYQYPFKVVELLHAPKRSSAQSIFNDTVAGNGLILKSTVCESIIPSGIAIYRALSTDLDSLGDLGHLSPDGTHAQEGLPCMMQAYVTAIWILKQVGINMSVNNASSVVDGSNYASINVPGPNLGTGVVVGTTEQVRLSQLVAIKAFKEGEYFVNANLTEYTT